MLARNVVTRRGRRFRGYFPSLKLGRMVAWESLLERDAILLLEFSPGVLSYREQPEEERYSDGAAIRSYYPDFLLELRSGSEARIEVKPAKKLDRPRVSAKLKHVASHYARQGKDFRVVTEQEIRREPLLGNLNVLQSVRRYRGADLPPKGLLQEVFSGGTLPFDDVARRIGRHQTLVLIAQGVLGCDLERSLAESNPVFLREGDGDASVLV